MQKITLLLVMLSLSLAVRTQELKCTITVRHQQVQGTNTNVFEALKKSSEDLLNTTRWTNLTYKPEERIECSMSIVVKSYENGIMDCELLVQARRPVWGSNYNTTILNFRDPSVKFAYQDFDALIVNQSFDKNLVAILAYYSYVIIGYSLDSFQKLGGNDAFSQAENIVNISQSRSEPESAGWRAFDKNGKRYELINNLLDERFGKFRQYFYDYHRLGLDMMSSNVDNGRAKIAEGLTSLEEINRLQPQAQAIISFIDAKKEEIVSLFAKHGTDEERNRVYNIMTTVNPSASTVYEKIKEK